MLYFCLQCLCSSSLFYFWFMPQSFHYHCRLFYPYRCTFDYLISTLSHFRRLKLKFTLNVKCQIYDVETQVLKTNHQSSNAKLYMPRFELRDPITNCQTPNFKCRGLSSGSQSLITNHQRQGPKPDAEVWNSYLLWGPTYLLGLGDWSYWLYNFVLCNSLSKVRVLRTNRQMPHVTHGRSRSETLYSEGRYFWGPIHQDLNH